MVMAFPKEAQRLLRHTMAFGTGRPASDRGAESVDASGRGHD